MKTTRLTWILLLMTGVEVFAQAPRPREQRRPPSVPPAFALFDMDHDRTISAEEIQAAPDVLKALDRNGDGELTLNEFRMPPPAQKNEAVRPPLGKPPVIAALDGHGDGNISPTELNGSPESLKALDKDGDGALSAQELRPPRGGGRPAGPPPEAE